MVELCEHIVHLQFRDYCWFVISWIAEGSGEAYRVVEFNQLLGIYGKLKPHYKLKFCLDV